MGAVHDRISDELAAWIGDQTMFFVGTAPLGGAGHVNLSPKGLDSLRVLDERTVAWVDLTGSGAETIAHLRENGRVTVMFCAFADAPRILRLYGRGAVALPGERVFDELQARLPALPGTRSIIRVDVDRVSTSCGFGVPQMQLVAPRTTLVDWAEQRSPEALAAFRTKRNTVSIDGLPALPGGPES